jgi:hypothetical protein
MHIVYCSKHHEMQDLCLFYHQPAALFIVSLLLVFVIRRLLEEKVGRQLLIFVAGKVSLNDLIAGKAESTQSFNSIALLLSDTDSSCTRGERAVVTHATDAITAEVLVAR